MLEAEKIQKVLYKSKGFIKRQSPTILTCVGAIGVIATAVITAKATPKALTLLEKAEEEKGEELTKVEKVKVAGPAYIPAALVGATTIGCMFGSNYLNKRKQASIISAYAALNATHKDYKDKVKELYGEEADVNVRDEVSKDNYKKSDIKKEADKELFYDEYSKRYFYSTKEKVHRAQYYLNRSLSMRDYAYLNEWYEELGLDVVEHGYDFGWSTGSCMDFYWQPWIDFTLDKMTAEDGSEYHIIRMLTEPIPNFADYC